MNLKGILFLFAVTTAFSFSTLAETTTPAPEPTQTSDASTRTFWQQAGHDFISPVTTKASYVLWPGLGVEAILIATKSQFSDKIQKHVAEEKPLGSTSSFGDAMGQLIPNAIYAGSMYGYYLKSDSPLARERAIIMTKATVYSGVVADVLKVIVRERRPNGSSDLASFPSGHATSAFAFASVIGAEHEWYYGVPAYALAAFVGFSRMNDNKHELHDVVAGALIGTVYGLGIYHESVNSGRHPTKADETKAFVVPVLLPEVAYLKMIKEF